jgi:cytochrome b
MKKTQSIGTQVWDWPVRIIHWTWTVLFGLLWWTAENDEMDVHRYAGYAMVSLLVFRIYWGFKGSNTARFSYFVKSPINTWRYAKKQPSLYAETKLGHNPLSAYSILLVLALLCAQVTTGLFAIDVDGWEAGPFNHYVSFETGRLCATWHEYLFNSLIGWLVLHLCAIAYYFWGQKQNLLYPMLSGKTAGIKNTIFTPAQLKHYFIGLALVCVVLWLILS